jgi:membrane protein DedA with SNARE-associated domain
MSAPHLPGVFATLAPLLDHYGYWAVGGTLFIENVGSPVSLGETMFIAGALYAGAGRLNIVTLCLIGLVVSVVGGAVGYLIGRTGGRALVARYGRYVALTGERVDKTEAYFNKRGPIIILISRWIEVVRQLCGFVSGLTEMPFPRFLFYNTIGAALWIAVWGTVGYLAGDHITAVYARATKYSLYLLIALVVVAAVLAVRYIVRRRRASQPGGASE